MKLDPKTTALLVIDLQNDTVGEEGAFASSGAAAFAREHGVVEKATLLAEAFRAAGAEVIHVWHIDEPGHVDSTRNAELYRSIAEADALVRGTWGAAPADGLEPQAGDHVVEKMRMSGWQGTRLETLLAGLGVDTIVVTGAWTNMSIEHTSRTGADKGFSMIVPEDGCSTMNADWHTASINFALQNVAQVTSCAAVKAALG